jgi:hypothetical protein
MLAESLPRRPAVLPVGLHPARNALLPPALPRIHNFGAMLEPRWIVGTERLDQ